MIGEAMHVEGHCPMGCGQTLFLGSGGRITCSWLVCPRPTAVDELLHDNEAEHIAVLATDHFTIRHPLRERLDDALLSCDLHQRLSSFDSPPHIGRYRVVESKNGEWEFRPAPSSGL